MKKIITAAVIAILFISVNAQAQVIDSGYVHKYYSTHPVKPATPKVTPLTKSLSVAVPSTTAPATGNILYTTPTIGLGGLAIQKSFNGWDATGTINPSFTYSIGVGQYTTNTDGSLNVEPYVNLGAFIAGGIQPQTILSGSFQVGGSLGFYK